MFGPYEDDEWEPPLGAAEEAIRQDSARRIRTLLDSLSPQDASMALFTFAERKRWNIRGHRKPPRRP